MSRQANWGEYSSDDDDDISTTNRNAFRTFKMRRQHRNLKSQKPFSGFASLFISKMKTEDSWGIKSHVLNAETFLRKMFMESPCASAINSCLASVFRCIPHGQNHQRSCTSSGYSSSEEWEPPPTRGMTSSISQRLKNSLPKFICQIISVIFTIFTVVLCSR
ncbi:hypothetical protein AALO_G00167530 [Alosa alosa]|uniref:Uncharacterized protein n=1 Tax=Alosa alosa TaxID=278164 RepID=A0AAV6GIJ3_9TELE|nr:hypothetical protein AALO_G00167530 [Alosa alosa]